MSRHPHTAPLARQATPAVPLELVRTESEQWQEVLKPVPKAAHSCCNQRCKQGRECPARDAHEELCDDTGYLLGRAILAVSCVFTIFTIALGVYFFA